MILKAENKVREKTLTIYMPYYVLELSSSRFDALDIALSALSL